MFQRKNARILLSSLLIFCGIGLMGNCAAQSQSSQNQSVFFANLQQLNISVPYLVSQKSLSRYELTRLLNAVECQDCIVPQSATRLKYDEPFWNNFLTLPGKDFRDIGYLSGNWQGTNYYYCVAKVGDDDSMRGYPLATSPIC